MTLITLIYLLSPNLIHQPDWWIIATGYIAFVRFLQLVIVHVLDEIVLSFCHVRTLWTTMRPIFGMFVLDVMAQISGEGASHVAQRAFVMIHVLPHMITQQPLQPKLLRTILDVEKQRKWGRKARDEELTCKFLHSHVTQSQKQSKATLLMMTSWQNLAGTNCDRMGAWCFVVTSRYLTVKYLDGFTLLSDDVIEKLGLAWKHTAALGTSDVLLVRVDAHVFLQVTSLFHRFTAI